MIQPPDTLCASETVAPWQGDLPELIRLAPDPEGDFILDHPLFTEVYDVVFENNSAIPPALDIAEVEVSSQDGNHTFHIRNQAGGVIEEFSQPDRRVRFGVYIDSDGNGASDYLLTTTDSPDRGVIITSDFELVAEMEGFDLGDNEITMQVPEELVGPSFDWIAFSGYSPVATAFHPTPLDFVFFVPEVDVVLPGDVVFPGRMREIMTSYAGPGQCQVYKSAYSSCPPQGNPPLSTVPGTPPGTSYQGLLIFRKQCGTRGLSLWCVDPPPGFFGKRVFDGAQQGWVARCPFTCGYNQQSNWDVDQDGIPDKVYHSVRDADCSAPHDQDGDGLRDVMEHRYEYATNRVESCNVERNAQGVQVNKRCCPARPPYANPANVPGSIDGSAPSYNCPP